VESTVDTDAIMSQIDEKRMEQRRRAGDSWGAPKHIVAENDLRLTELDREITDLKAQLYKAHGGKIDN
jgi:hypothetical protein